MTSVALPCTAILFDCDGVLVDSDASVTRAWSTWAERYGLDADDVVASVHGRPVAETVALLLPGRDREAGRRLIVDLERADAASCTAVPGARKLLDGLPDGTWAVVTSGEPVLARARLAAAGLPIPDVLVTAGDISRGKPDPECYLRAAELLGVPASRCVVLEDSSAGITAARAARVAAVVGVGARAHGLDVDVEVPDLNGLSLAGGCLHIPSVG